MKKGFSLVELVVVCSIIGIMSILALAYLSQGNEDRKYAEVAGREVAAAMREAQNYALAGKVNDSNQFLCSVVFSATQGTGDYSLSYTYHDGDQICNNSGTYYQKSLNNNIVFSTVSGSVTMTPPHASISRASQRLVISKSGSNYYYICFCNSGKIYESTTSCDTVANCT